MDRWKGSITDYGVGSCWGPAELEVSLTRLSESMGDQWCINPRMQRGHLVPFIFILFFIIF